MAWYHWIAAYLIIIGGVTFFVIPHKPLWLLAACILLIVIGVLMVFFLPGKEDKYASKEG